MVYFEDEIDKINPKMLLNDLIESYSVKFWYTNDVDYRTTKTLTMYIEDGDDWKQVVIALAKRYIDPEIISVRYQ